MRRYTIRCNLPVLLQNANVGLRCNSSVLFEMDSQGGEQNSNPLHASPIAYQGTPRCVCVCVCVCVLKDIYHVCVCVCW